MRGFDLQAIALYMQEKELLRKSFFAMEREEVEDLCAYITTSAAKEAYYVPPFITNGELRIPYNAPPKYRYWQQGGQSLKETLEELGADEEMFIKYVYGRPTPEPKEIVVVDVETTHLSPKKGSIVEVGIVSLDVVNGKITTLFNSLCNDDFDKERDGEAWIFKNSNLSVAEVEKAPPLKELLPDIQEIIKNYPLGCTAFNSPLDFSWLESRGIEIPLKLPDPMRLATPLCELPAKSRKHGRYKYPTMQETWDYFFPKSKYREKHRGADDARHEAQIVLKLYRMGIFTMENETEKADD